MLKLLKYIKNLFKRLCVLILTFLILSYAISQIPAVKSQIKATLTKHLAAISKFRVKLDNIDGFYPLTARISNLRFYNDENKEIFSIKTLNISLNPLTLLFKKISIYVQAHGLFNLEDTELKISSEGRWDSWQALILKGRKKQDNQAQIQGNIYISFKDLQLKSPFSINQKAEINFLNFNLLNKYIKTQGNLKAPLQSKELDGKIRGTAKLPFQKDSFQFEGSLKGFLLDPHFNGNFTLNGFSIEPLTFSELTGKFNLAFFEGKLLAHLESQTLILDERVALTGDLDLSQLPKKIKVDHFILESPSTALKGSFSYTPKAAMLTGEVSGKMHHLEVYSPLFNQYIEGSSLINLQFYEHEEMFTQAIQFECHTDNLKYLNWDLKKAHVNGEYLPELQQGSLILGAENIKNKQYSFKKLEVNSTLGIGNQSFQINLEGKANHYSMLSNASELFNVNLGGNYHLSKKDLDLSIKYLFGKYDGHEFLNKKDTCIYISSENIIVSPFNLSFAEGTLCGQLNLSPSKFNIDLEMNRFSLNLLRLIIPNFSITGLASGSLHTQSLDAHVIGHSALHLKNLRSSASLSQSSNSLSLILALGLTKKRFDLKLLSENSSDHLDLSLPLSFMHSPFLLSLADDQALSANIAFKGMLSPLLEILLPDHNRITGNLDLLMTLEGCLNTLSAKGHAFITKGSYESLHSGVLIQDIDAKIEAKGQTISLNSISASDGDRGIISGHGYAKLENSLPYFVSLELQNATFIHLDLASGSGNGQLELKGDLNSALLDGSISILKANINIPDHLAKPPPNLSVTYIDNTPLKPPPLHWSSSPLIPITLNVKIIIPPSKLSFQGRGLRSKWQGSLLLSDSISKPQIKGSLDLDKGSFFFSGKNFTLNEGQINFCGDPKTALTINLNASLESDKYKILAFLNGPLTKPHLQLQSLPPLDLKDILSIILFNHPINELSGLEALQLTIVMQDLIEGGGSKDVIFQLKRRFGIEQINILDNDKDNPAIQLGFYLKNGAFISLQKEIYSGDYQIAAETLLRPMWHLQLKVNNSREGRIYLKWRKHY